MKEIYHHGVLGMHWGVRRYQNPDGTLTEAGKKRAAKIYGSERKMSSETKKARKIASEEANSNRKYGEKLKTASEKQLEKAKKYAENTNERIKIEEKANNLAKRANSYLENSKELSKFLSDLDDGTIKAGKNFMTQTDVNVNPIIIPGVVAGGSIEIEKRLLRFND